MSQPEKPVVELYSDGACIGNPGPGGWAYILKHPKSGRVKEDSGGEHNTTNNRMELVSVIRGLEALKSPSIVELAADSQYVLGGIQGWMAKWKANGWKKSRKGNVLVINVDLWRRLDELVQLHEVRTTWIKGHAGHAENERCDQLAYAAATAVAKTPKPATMRSAQREFDEGMFG